MISWHIGLQSQRPACPHPAAAAAAAGSGYGPYTAKEKNSRPLLLLREFLSLSGLRPIFLILLLLHKDRFDIGQSLCSSGGSRYVHANAHRRPRPRFWVFAAETSSLSDYIRWTLFHHKVANEENKKQTYNTSMHTQTHTHTYKQSCKKHTQKEREIGRET